jgi:hypothetical protein
LQRRRRRLVLVAGAALLAAVSLLGKATAPGAVPEQSAAQRVEEFLTARGWAPRGSAPLVAGDGGGLLRFRAPGCSGVVGVGVVPPNGEVTSLFAQAAGPAVRVFYAYRGRISREPPRLAYLHAKLAQLMAILGLPQHLDQPVVAVSQPQVCRLEEALIWSDL